MSLCHADEAEIYMSRPSPALIDSPAVWFEKLAPTVVQAPFSTHCSSQKQSIQNRQQRRQQQQLLSPGWAQIHLPRVYPSAAVECVTPCPGAITVPLHTRFPQFITTIGACQLLLMIAQPLPMKETIDWQWRWGGWGLPRHYLVFFFILFLFFLLPHLDFLRYCSSWAAFLQTGTKCVP